MTETGCGVKKQPGKSAFSPYSPIAFPLSHDKKTADAQKKHNKGAGFGLGNRLRVVLNDSGKKTRSFPSPPLNGFGFIE